MDLPNPYRPPVVAQPLLSGGSPIVYRDPNTVILMMLNVVATVISFIPCFVVIALPIGCWATFTLQIELNKLSTSLATDPAANG